MKVLSICFFVGLVLFSCKKPEKAAEESYELPWSTEYISYTNSSIGNNGHGYKIFYKSKLIKEDWDMFGGPALVDSLLVNKQILYLLKSANGMGYTVIYTKDGGVTWVEEGAGSPVSFKLHLIEPDLLYCTSLDNKKVLFYGVGASDLKYYRDTLTSGVHYIYDLGTNTNLDSTVINIGDTAQFVILFN